MFEHEIRCMKQIKQKRLDFFIYYDEYVFVVWILIVSS